MSTTIVPYDLIAIGAGMAGSGAAEKCARAGWRVAIVDASRSSSPAPII